MNFTDKYIQRPILAVVISALILLAGIQAFTSMSVRQYPRSDNSAITITTAYIGADAELVKGFVTSPLERAMAGVSGIDYIESSSKQGLSTITVRLQLNYDPIKALAEISARVDKVRGNLPRETRPPALAVESADSIYASAYLSFQSDTLKENQITDYVARVVQPRLLSLPGVQQAKILGGRNYAMRIWLKPDLMAAHNISPTQVRRALAANNYLAAFGKTDGSLVQISHSANTNISTVDEFKDLVVRSSGNSILRISDIADVELGSDDYNTDARYSGRRAVFLGIWTTPDSNELEVIKGVKAEVAELQNSLPSGLDANIAYDATSYIDRSIKEVLITLVETLIIVMLVVYFFLGSLRSVLIPIIAIPISLIGALFLIQIFGFSINLLTLLAMVLAVGLVVDDAIVIVENVERYMRQGKSRIEAATAGARELIGPIIAMTVALIAVYIPIGFQGGLTGSLFREFAYTLAGAVFISGIVALTLSPIMSARLLVAHEDKSPFSLRIANGFENLRARYARRLNDTLQVRSSIIIFWVAISIMCVPLFILSAKELAPTEDQGVFFSTVKTAPNNSLEATMLYTNAINDTYESFEETRSTFQITYPNGGYSGMILEPWESRDRTTFDIIQTVRSKLNDIPGVDVFTVQPPALPGGGQYPVEFIISSIAETSEILEVAKEIQRRATESEIFAYPLMIDTQIDLPQSEVIFNRNQVADLGLTMEQLGADVSTLLGGGYINRFNLDGRSYPVMSQLIPSDNQGGNDLQNLYVGGPDDTLIQLGFVAEMQSKTVPRSLNRFQQLNAVKLSGMPIRTLDTALTFLEKTAQEVMPPGYTIDYTGESRQLRLEGNRFVPAFTLAIVLIFLVLAVQFNSFRDPLIILAGSVPLAMFGALIFTYMKMPHPHMPYWTEGWTTTMNIYSQIGLVTLIGLVAKNGILMVEFANKLQEQGYTKLSAIQQSSSTRLRPILMTTAATVAGHFPLVLVTGAGAEARNSIGLVLVGGMVIGTLFTLFVLPSIYMAIAKNLGGEQVEEPGYGAATSTTGLLSQPAADEYVAEAASVTVSSLSGAKTRIKRKLKTKVELIDLTGPAIAEPMILATAPAVTIKNEAHHNKKLNNKSNKKRKNKSQTTSSSSSKSTSKPATNTSPAPKPKAKSKNRVQLIDFNK